MLYPLSMVIGISMIKDVFEDRKRHKSDRQENERKVHCIFKTDQTFKQMFWKDVKVGDLVKVHDEEYFPADLMLCSSSETHGTCYVETKNLDGETNLKTKQAAKGIREIFSKNESEMGDFGG